MRRWRLPSAKRLRLPSSASGDETRSRLETNDVDRASGWPLWFCMAGHQGREPGPQSSHQLSREIVNSCEHAALPNEPDRVLQKQFDATHTVSSALHSASSLFLQARLGRDARDIVASARF